MKINLTGTVSTVHETLQLMVQNGIPFIRFIRYSDRTVSMGSRKVLSEWEYRKTKKYYHGIIALTVKDRDIDLAVLLSTAKMVVSS